MASRPHPPPKPPRKRAASLPTQQGADDEAGTQLLALQARADQAATLLRALANPDRLMLMCQLVNGERSVTELGCATGIEQPSLSQQLGVLRGERLVATRREGKHVVYRVASPAALAVLEALYALFCSPDASWPAARGRTAAAAANPLRP